ncbi:MAG: hypothetical protein JSW06_07320 [Thermoplasmatales archaeon]|nr:MAG: hypothetical protein JSW06_07320 [Thermoplasmatales archaeon]
MMKKIFTLLVVEILVLSGLGTVATSEKPDIKSVAFQPELIVEARGGFGVHVTITNLGNMSIEILGNITVTIRATLMLRGGYSILHIPIPIPINSAVSVGTGLVLGIGHCTVNVTIDIDDDGVIDGESSNTGLIFLPLVLVGKFTIPLS